MEYGIDLESKRYPLKPFPDLAHIIEPDEAWLLRGIEYDCIGAIKNGRLQNYLLVDKGGMDQYIEK